MKTHKRRIWRTLCCAGLALMAAGVAFLIFGTREAESLTLSAGLQHLADRSYVAASTSGQGEITLDGEPITRKNIAKISFATSEHSFFPNLTAAAHRDF